MANTIIWDALPSAAIIMPTNQAGMLLSLEDDGIGVSNEVANGGPVNDTMASFQLYIAAWVGVPADYFECHIVYKLDDTLFADGEAGDVADPNLGPNTLVGIFPVTAVNGAQLIPLIGVPIHPFDFKVCIVNRTGSALADGAPDTCTLTIFPYSLEVQ